MPALLIERTADVTTGAVRVSIDRHILIKRRWRATASDGSELAVNLDKPVPVGTVLESADGRRFLVYQNPEEVLSIPLPKKTEMAAKVGWYLGNQHLQVEIRADEILLEKVKTLADSLDRIGIPYTLRTDVFNPALHSNHAR